MAKLEVAVLIGAESKEFLSALTAIVFKLESLLPVNATVSEVSEKAPVAAKKVATKKAAPVEEESFDLDAEEASEEKEEPTITKADLIAACRENRDVAIKVLKKLKVNSVHELKPAQYSKVMAEIGA